MSEGFWPFRRRPLGPVAQCIVELLDDETAWRHGLLAMHHQRGDVVVRCTGLFTSVAVGEAGVRLQGRDRRAVDRAYAAARRRITRRLQAEREQRVQQALGLPTQPNEPPPPETIEAVEARVRRLRQALAQSAG